MKKIKYHFICYLFLTLFIHTHLLGQKGMIIGTILDQETGEPLIGATVTLEAAPSIGTVSDLDGNFELKVAPRTHTILFSYLGYQEKKVVGVKLSKGEIKTLNINLVSDAVKLAIVEVVDEAILRTENSTLINRRNAEAIQNSFSAEGIRKFALSDVGTVMKKVTGATVSAGKYVYVRGLGDRYSITQLNGLVIPSADPYRNGVQLDLIPANLLDNVITSKSFTPDQPGAFTGGNIDINTKGFPEQAFLTFSVSGTFNAQNNLIDNFLTHTGGKTDYWGFDDGNRALPDVENPATKIILEQGCIANIICRTDPEYCKQAGEVANLFNREFTPDPTNSPINHGFGLSFGNQYAIGENRLGVVFSTAFKKDYLHLDNFETGSYQIENYSLVEYLPQGAYRATKSTETANLNGFLSVAYKIGKLHSLNLTTLYNHNTEKTSRYLRGERFDNLIEPEFNLEGRSLVFQERALTNVQLGGKHILNTTRKTKIEWRLSQANSSQLEPDTRFFENDIHLPTNTYSIPSSDVQDPFHFFRELKDEQTSGKIDFSIPFGTSLNNKFKFGGLYSQKNRQFTEHRYQLCRGDAQPFTGDVDKYLSDENYGLIMVNGEYRLGVHPKEMSLIRNNYSGDEMITAFYGMLTLDLGQDLKLIGGARYESTNLFVTSQDTKKPEGRIDVQDILPSVNLVYNLTSKMNWRAAFSQTIARPNMREIAPFEAYDPLLKLTYFGNPALKRTEIDNYDLRWEWFPNAGELVAISGYYKKFHNPIVQAFQRAPNPEIEFANVPNAELMGIELEYRKNLGTLLPILEHFKLNTNLSFINSTAKAVVIPGLEKFSTTERPFEGQAPFILNASLIYSNPDNGIDATLSLNMTGDRLEVIGREENPDIYLRGQSFLDFTFLKKVGNFNIKITATNLLNTNYFRSAHFFGNEETYTLYKRGSTFGLGLAYTIRKKE